MASVKLKKPEPIRITNFKSGGLFITFSFVVLEYQYYLHVLSCMLKVMLDKLNHKLKTVLAVLRSYRKSKIVKDEVNYVFHFGV